MPLGSSSAAPVMRPGPIFARGCFLTRRQRSASDLARKDFLCCLDGCTAPHLASPCKRHVSSRTGPATVHPLSLRFNNAFTCILVLSLMTGGLRRSFPEHDGRKCWRQFYPKTFPFHRPTNFGGRFALKASTPSLKSSDC